MSVAVKLNCYRFIELLPDSNRLVVRPCHDEIGEIADSECPNFAVMALKLLDVLKLNRFGISLTGVLLSLFCTYLITIPILKKLILSDCPKIMTFLFERHLHHAVVMRKYRLMAVAKIETPDFDVFVSGRRHDKL